MQVDVRVLAGHEYVLYYNEPRDQEACGRLWLHPLVAVIRDIHLGINTDGPRGRKNGNSWMSQNSCWSDSSLRVSSPALVPWSSRMLRGANLRKRGGRSVWRS